MARVDPLADPPGNRVTNGRGKRSRCRSTTTLVEPIDTGMAWVIANRLRGIRPQAAFLITTLIGYATLVGALVALGLVLTKILIPIDAIRHADEAIPGWMADHRSGWLDNASDIVSRMGDIPALPILVALILVIAALVRRFRIGAFLLTAVLMEVTAYRIGALAVPRQRPDVHRLDTLPVDQSFPSGHVAASVVVYVGLALLVTSHFQRRWVAALTWSLGLTIVFAIALSRIYRGMHHPLDTLSGAALGAGCLIVAVIAVRVYGSVQRRRDGHPARAVHQKDVT